MGTKKPEALERHSKGHFFKNTVHLERGVPYFAFVSTKAVLVRKIGGLCINLNSCNSWSSLLRIQKQ